MCLGVFVCPCVCVRVCVCVCVCVRALGVQGRDEKCSGEQIQGFVPP